MDGVPFHLAGIGAGASVREACRAGPAWPVPAGRAVCSGEARGGLGLHPELPVGASGQRPYHRDPAVRAVRHPRRAGAARPCGRLSVRGPDVGAPRAQLPAPVRAARPDRCRSADHRLAVHDLARRLPARRDRLRIFMRQQARATSMARRRCYQCRRPGHGLRRDPAHHRGPRTAPGHHARRRLYAGAADRHRRGLVAEPRGAAHPVAAARHIRCSTCGSWWSCRPGCSRSA